MAEDRPDIPDPIKRAVRQKCGFGCVLCGLPIFHYDHIEEYSVVGEHKEENIVLLCPNHHQDKTSRRISKELILNAVENPHNLNQDFSAPHLLRLEGDRGYFDVGGNIFTFNFTDVANHFAAIIVQGTEVLGIKIKMDFFSWILFSQVKRVRLF